MIGLVVCHDLLVRFSDFTAHYTDLGVLPLQAWYTQYKTPGFWSLAALSSNGIYTLILFFVGLAAAVALVFDKYVRLSTVLCWVVLLSLQNRNPILYQGGDDMLRMVLFWSVFIPKYPKGTGKAYQIVGLATMALLIQALYPLFFSGLYKGAYEWWYKGTAFNYALQLDQLTRPFGLWLRQYPIVTGLLTRVVYIVELAVLPVFLFPLFRERIRVIVFWTLFAFSLGIILCFMIGLFPLCIMACSVLFIPTSFWQRFKHREVEIYTQDDASVLVWWGRRFVLLTFFITVLWWNVVDVRGSRVKFPRSMVKGMVALRLNQTWGMFAPTVFKDDGWLVLSAKLSNGDIVDLNNDNLPVDFEKPSYVLDRFKNDRWRKYTEQIYSSGNAHLRKYFADYLEHEYIEANKVERSIEHLDIYYMRELTPQGEEQFHIEKVLLYSTKK